MVVTIRASQIMKALGYTLFGLMIFVPTTYQRQKTLLLLPLIIGLTLPIMTRLRIALHPKIAILTVLSLLTGVAAISIGLLNGTPGAKASVTVYVMWPLLYTLFIAGAARRDVIDGLLRVMAVAMIAGSAYVLMFILVSANVLPSWLYFPIDAGQRVGLHEGYVQVAIHTITPLIFTVPFLLAALLVWPNDKTMPIPRAWMWVGLTLGLAAVLLSGRRAIWLVVAFAPLIVLALAPFLARPQRRIFTHRAVQLLWVAPFLLATVYAGLRTVVNVDIGAVVQHVAEGFEFGSGETDSTLGRREQYYALMHGWEESPWVGSGLGAGAKEYIRAPDAPWAYELTYVALLFHTGLLGFGVYAGSVLWIYGMGLRMMRSGDRLGLAMFPLLVGMTCFLIANATNPYLEMYDSLWVIFLPVAVINLWLLQCAESRRTPAPDAQIAEPESAPFAEPGLELNGAHAAGPERKPGAWQPRSTS